MAVAALVLGIVSVVFSFIPGLMFIGTIVGIVGIILAIVAKKNPATNNGMATAGLVLSVIGVGLSLILYIACVACAHSVANQMMNMM